MYTHPYAHVNMTMFKLIIVQHNLHQKHKQQKNQFCITGIALL